MHESFPTWITGAAGTIRDLAERPWTLFVLLLAVNAIARPCTSTSHDARLYSLQALNHAEDSAYADDVFLRYGSQDRYSAFSQVAGPIVREFGVRPVFFTFYLIFNTLFLFALFRLVRTLISDPVVSTLSLIYLTTAPLAFGGCDIFMVHEQFFTPRTIGSAMTLFAIERLLQRSYLSTGFLLAAGLAMHPLMAFGGVLIACSYLTMEYLSARWFGGLLVSVSAMAAVLLALPVVSAQMFGVIDDDWHLFIRIAVGYNYPDTWDTKDWLNLALSLVLPVAGAAWLFKSQPNRQRFLLAAALAGSAGFLVTLVASLSPYALLFQGQPYRVLWILKVLQIPLAFAFIVRWSVAESLPARLGALTMIAFFAVGNLAQQELTIIAMALALSMGLAVLNRDGLGSNWWWLGLARGFVLGALGWMTYRWWFFVSKREVISQHFDLNEFALFDLFHPFLWLVGICIAASIWNAWPAQATVRWAALVLATIVPSAWFATEACPTFRREHTRIGQDIAFIREYVGEQRRAEGRHPSVYCSLGRADLLWIDVPATSYFDIIQTAGVMFQRQTAIELQRRIGLVAKFEMARQRQEAVFLDNAKKVGMENLFHEMFDGPAPTALDLVRLANDPALDYIVIPKCFDDLYSATNGRVYLYDCAKMRKAGGGSTGVRFAARER